MGISPSPRQAEKWSNNPYHYKTSAFVILYYKIATFILKDVLHYAYLFMVN